MALDPDQRWLLHPLAHPGLCVDFDALPMTIDCSTPQTTARLSAVIGLAAIVVGLWLPFAPQSITSGFWITVFLSTVLGLGGLALLSFGVWAMRNRATLTFTPAGVTITSSTAAGHQSLSLAYRDFESVLLRSHESKRPQSTPGGSVAEVFAPGSRQYQTHTWQIVELKHADAWSSVPVYVRLGDASPREYWARLALRLQLPALEAVAGDVRQYDPGDVLQEIADAGPARVPILP